MTLPQFHRPYLSAVALGDQQHWNAVVASFPVQPWYFFVYEAAFLGSRVNHPMLVVWKELLVKISDAVPEVDLHAVYRMDPGEGGKLTFPTLKAVWAPTAEEQENGLEAIFRMQDRAEMVGPRLKPVSSQKPRRLVFLSRHDMS